MSEAAIPQKSPYVMDMEAGDYHWCRCGHSKKQPFCDGSHAASGTDLGPLKVTIEKTGKIAWCGCKRSANQPFCDGAHSKL